MGGRTQPVSIQDKLKNHLCETDAMVKFLNSNVLQLVCVFVAVACGSHSFSGQSTLYTEGPGVNPPFGDIRDDISNGYSGTVIDVNNALVEGGFFGSLGIEDDLKIHTLASSVISERQFCNWSRWYQTDGATQIFRLFPGEENVRNDRPLAARIEAFDANTGWTVAEGQWHEWVARYTIVKPINAAIFQAKDQDVEAWSVHINMNASGKVSLTHRRPLPGQPKTHTLLENAIGQPFDIRIRDNGLDYEVYFGDMTVPFATGQFVRNSDPGDNFETRFRWGIYVGAQEVQSEALIFVSHASVDPDIEYSPPVVPEFGDLIAGWDTFNSGATPDASVVTANVTGSAVTTSEGINWHVTDGRAQAATVIGEALQGLQPQASRVEMEFKMKILSSPMRQPVARSHSRSPITVRVTSSWTASISTLTHSVPKLRGHAS